MPQISITRTTTPKTKPDFSKAGFGQYFSDHMFLVDYDGKEWVNPRVTPYQPIPLDPAASVLHYGQALFEGMKAFRQNDGTAVLFRPEFNWRRISEGAERLCMKAPPKEIMIEGIRAVVKTDDSWIPTTKGQALYIRPTLIGTESFLGVKPSERFLFYVILSPVGPYYKEGLNPISIWVEDQYVRAAPGGLGATKAGANYASSLLAAKKAKDHGFAQVLWLDVNHEYVEEVGTMNVFFVFGRPGGPEEIITPSLDGTILAGGTRGCVIELLRDMGKKVTERKLSMKEIVEAHRAGMLQEAFGTGTGAVISPMGELVYKGERLVMNDKKIGPISQKVYDEMTAIQYGEKPDHRNWIEKI